MKEKEFFLIVMLTIRERNKKSTEGEKGENYKQIY